MTHDVSLTSSRFEHMPPTALALAALLHVAAALFHALIRRDGVFEAMSPLPVGKREGQG